MKSVQKLFIFILIKLLVASSAYAGIESTGTVTGLGKVITLTLPAPYNETVYAGTFTATIGGNATNLYCIDISHPLAFNETYQDVSSTDSVLTYVLNNYYPHKAYPYTNAMNTVENEAGAVQLALWHFSDGLNVNQVTNVDATVITRANAIIADANANAHIFSLNSFAIVIPNQSFNIGSPIQFTVQAFDNMGIAMPNVQITLSTTSGTLSATSTVTGATGVSPVITLTPAAGQTTATVTASGTVGIPAGTKYYHVADPNGKQKLILATPTIASRTITRAITWYNQIQLVVTKTADKASCNDGDVVNYTIKVKNTGTSQAQNVVVSDQLPAILSYVSATPSGAFDATTGLWSVGTLNVGDSATLVLKTKVSYANPSASSYSLGVAGPYNLFVIDTLIQPSADTQGKLAVGGYADLQGYSVGDQLPANSGNVLVVGNHLTFVTGRVYNGKAVYQNYITSTQGFSADSGIVRDSVLDFAGAKIYLQNLSQQLASLSKTDTVKYLPNNSVELDGSRSGLNVFFVDGSKLLNTNDISINVPANATVLVNISGTTSKLFGGFEVNGTTKDKILLNFYQATTLNFSGIDVKASVLAPYADLTFPAGIVSGQLIVRKMTGSGQINLSPFTGAVSRDTSITNIATVTGASVSSMPCSYSAQIAFARMTSITRVDGIKNSGNTKNESFKLEQNYPNPFNPTTKLRFSVANAGQVRITVYNAIGQEVAIVADGYFAKGSYEATFDATRLSSGVYFARMSSGAFTSMQKMILQK